MTCFARKYTVLLALIWSVVSLRAQDGFCMVNGTTTGGAGGPTVTVTNGTDFNTQINVNGPLIIQVQGVISIGRVFTKPNKTIIGLGTNATLLGNLNISDSTGATNVIVRNLRITAPANDGLTIWNAHHVWIDHCTLYDTGDGLCDMNRGSQYVTVSWCKFHYVNQVEHRFTMIADGWTNLVSGNWVTNFGYYTLHHNWWSTRCDQRQASSSFGRLHYYNNYWNCTNNFYATISRADTEVNSENNYYSGVNNPIYNTGFTAYNSKIRTSGNIYSGCSGTISPGTDSVFSPAYGYTLDATATVPTNVMANAGAPGPDTMPIPPKIWDGGGSDNNLNTANNWGYAGGYNETPKDDDVLVFAGSTRTSPNNNITAGKEFYGLTFSNNAASFSLSGNQINLGGPIIDDSPNTQFIYWNTDFGFGQFHYGTNREINVSSPNGQLAISGVISGDANAYFDSYSITKTGPGSVSLDGLNTVRASWFFNGGLVTVHTINDSVPNSLGYGSAITFNGGGLTLAGNVDISTRTVTINTNGAILATDYNVTLANPVGNNGVGPLTKLGSGTLTLNGNNNYKGNTFIGGGVLALGTAGVLSNTKQIVLTNSLFLIAAGPPNTYGTNIGTLDVSGRADGTLTLTSGQSLLGNGSVRGSVTASSGSTVAPGFSIGTLTITNALTFQSGSTNLMELDRANHTNDLITGMASVTYGGKLIVTNLGGSLVAGDSFKLFGAGSYNNAFSSITLPTLTGNLIWTNRLAVDGTLAVVSPVNPAPTNLWFSAVDGQIQFSWPDDHTGWRLEMQTNSANTGLGTNWVNVAGSDQTNQVSLPVYAGPGVIFYRMAYP